MKSRLFILMVLFMLFGVSCVSAQSELTYMSGSFEMDSGPDRPHRHYVYTAHSGQNFGGLINITEQRLEVISKVRVMLLNEANFNKFRSDEDYDEMFYIDVTEDNETIFWEATYKTGEKAYFVYWYMEPTGLVAGQVGVYIEMWDWEHYTTITYPTNTTTITNTTTTITTDTGTTDTGTTTPIEEGENIFLIYLLCGVLGGIVVIVIYAKVRPRKIKYVWEVK